MEQTLDTETVTQENAKILPSFAAVEQRARVHGEAGSHSCAPGQNRAPERPSQVEGVADNDLTRNVGSPMFPAPSLPTGKGLTGMQAPENSQNENPYDPRLLSHSNQASDASQSANSVSCRDNHYEDVQTSTSRDSDMGFPSARNLEIVWTHRFPRTHWKKLIYCLFQWRRMGKQDLRPRRVICSAIRWSPQNVGVLSLTESAPSDSMNKRTSPSKE